MEGWGPDHSPNSRSSISGVGASCYEERPLESRKRPFLFCCNMVQLRYDKIAVTYKQLITTLLLFRRHGRGLDRQTFFIKTGQEKNVVCVVLIGREEGSAEGKRGGVVTFTLESARSSRG